MHGHDDPAIGEHGTTALEGLALEPDQEETLPRPRVKHRLFTADNPGSVADVRLDDWYNRHLNRKKQKR